MKFKEKAKTVQVNMPRAGTLNRKTRGANGEGDTMENLEFSKLDTAGISPIKNVQ